MANNQLTTIYIIRHGQSEVNAHDYQEVDPLYNKNWGERGAPLSELGKQQSQTIAKKLQNVNFDAIFSSNKARTLETAEIIAKGRGVPVQIDSTIYERRYGKEFYKLQKSERIRLEMELSDLNEEQKFLHAYPGGENASDATKRFTTFLGKIIPKYKNKTILIVNHGGIMRFFLVYIGWANYNELPPDSIENTGYYVLETDGNTFTITETHGIIKNLKH